MRNRQTKTETGRTAAVAVAALLAFCAFHVRAEILCGTWNMRWFPSGRAEHRASKRVEAATTADAADLVRSGLSAMPGSDGAILFFQELRDDTVFTNFVATIGVSNLVSASVSAFRDFDRRLMWQQCAIATTYPVVEASWSYWRRGTGKLFIPRGYAYAVVDAGADGLVACFCIHLKSNYGATTAERREQNVLKRETAIMQILETAKKLKTRDGRPIDRIVVAGDFNTDPAAKLFSAEKTIPAMKEAGFASCFDGMPKEKRITHPGSKRYPGATFDYIFHRGLVRDAEASISPDVPLSDHRMVWVRLRNPAYGQEADRKEANLSAFRRTVSAKPAAEVPRSSASAE